MKKLFAALLIGGFSFLLSCEGPPGPPGVPGVPGQDGINLLSEVFEVEVDFTADNNYEQVFDFDPPIFDDDVVMAYLEWETVENNRIWRALPQTLFFDEGVLIYNFDFSSSDFRLFLDTTFEPNLLSDEWTQNQNFRIVVIPGEFATARIDLNDYEAVMKMLNATEKDVVKLQPRK
jgi:hypothetical protein